MFEKEAEEWVKTKGTDAMTCLKENIGWDDVCEQAFKDGAEFGYNKANEWHYVKDGYSYCTYEDGECIKISVLEKENAELEEKISVLLSCKNCPENKGGYICQKEYEDKCLAQKIQYIKELKEENAELRKDNSEWEKASDKWKSLYESTNNQLTEAKEIIKRFSEFVNNGIEYDPEHPQEHTDLWNKLCEETEQFLKDCDIDNAIQQANKGLDFDKIADEMGQDLKDSEVGK